MLGSTQYEIKDILPVCDLHVQNCDISFPSKEQHICVWIKQWDQYAETEIESTLNVFKRMKLVTSVREEY